VRVDEDVLEAGLRHEVVEGVERLEPIVDDKREARFARGTGLRPRVSSCAICIVPVLSGRPEEVVAH